MRTIILLLVVAGTLALPVCGQVETMLLGATRPSSSPVGRTNSLRDGLVAYYKFDESNATDAAADAHTNGLTLAQISDPKVTAAGIISGCRTNEVTEGFFATNNAFIPKAELTLTAWAFCQDATPSATRALVWKYDAGASARCFSLSLLTSGLLACSASSNQTDQSVVQSITSMDDSTWCFLAVRKTSAGVLSIRVGKGATLNDWNSTNTFGGLFATNYQIPLMIGHGRSSGSFTLPLIGKMDEVGIWTNALTDAQITNLFNGGSGLPYGSFD